MGLELGSAGSSSWPSAPSSLSWFLSKTWLAANFTPSFERGRMLALCRGVASWGASRLARRRVELVPIKMDWGFHKRAYAAVLHEEDQGVEVDVFKPESRGVVADLACTSAKTLDSRHV